MPWFDQFLKEWPIKQIIRFKFNV